LVSSQQKYRIIWVLISHN